ncbi:hypothetical protein C8Q80DRAFT_916425 [Daedaleopsis nitida]|nr:hypothetical protein C8Q80DRAFT_916425 [Daedaleopsis nitida]
MKACRKVCYPAPLYSRSPSFTTTRIRQDREHWRHRVPCWLTDIFEIPLINNRLLVDDFARNGFRTVMPDPFQGEALPADVFTRTDIDRDSWLARHTNDTWELVVDAVIAALQAEGVTWIGTAAYCSSAWYLAFKQSHDRRAPVAPAHSRGPTVQSPAVDQQLRDGHDVPARRAEGRRRDLGGGKFAPGYERMYWEGCSHGFADCGDMVRVQLTCELAAEHT